jgi:uncharacterized protein (UPF0332 family)
VREEPRTHLEKAQESLDVAQSLLKDGHPEIAISRAYFVMFYLAEALLLKRGLTFSKHSAVIAMFGQELAKSGSVPVEFHRYLIDAQQLRLIADYRHKRLTVEEAQVQIERATAFLEFAKQFLSQEIN